MKKIITDPNANASSEDKADVGKIEKYRAFLNKLVEEKKLYTEGNIFMLTLVFEGVVAPWCHPLTLQPEQSGGVGSIPGRTPLLERHDKGSRSRIGLLCFCDPSAWR